MAIDFIRLGIIGMSPGNGHPYSWSAIFNGYDTERMRECPFQVIPEYLAEQKWPSAQIEGARVTHVWTQGLHISEKIAEASHIAHVVLELEDMIGEVDAILLARDDSENHMRFAKPFLEAGLPIFIDKPLATSVVEARNLFALQQSTSQIFSCSALRYSEALKPKKLDALCINQVDAQIPKYWKTYSVHLVELVVANFPNRGALVELHPGVTTNGTVVHVTWENLIASFTTSDSADGEFRVVYRDGCNLEICSTIDTFHCFKVALESFLVGIKQRRMMIPRSETMEIIQIIEHGCK